MSSHRKPIKIEQDSEFEWLLWLTRKLQAAQHLRRIEAGETQPLHSTPENNLVFDKPLVSVVIPTYNRAQKTIAAIESVLAQTYAHLEIIVIDDGSTDDSGEFIRQFLNQRADVNTHAQEMRYFRQPNQGSSSARNAGIEKAQGEYIAFLDSDDAWLPEKLEWQIWVMERFKGHCEACFTDAQLVSNTGGVTSSFEHHGRHYKKSIGIDPDGVKLLTRFFGGYWVSTLLARTEFIKRIGAFDPAIVFCEDTDLYFRLSQATSFAYVNHELASIDRISRPTEPDGRTWERIEVRLRGQQDMLEKWLRTGKTMPPEVHKATVQYLRQVHSKWANWYLETERYDEARQAVASAMKCEITLGLTVKWVLAWLAPTFARKITPKAPSYL